MSKGAPRPYRDSTDTSFRIVASRKYLHDLPLADTCPNLLCITYFNSARYSRDTSSTGNMVHVATSASLLSTTRSIRIHRTPRAQKLNRGRPNLRARQSKTFLSKGATVRRSRMYLAMLRASIYHLRKNPNYEQPQQIPYWANLSGKYIWSWHIKARLRAKNRNCTRIACVVLLCCECILGTPKKD